MLVCPFSSMSSKKQSAEPVVCGVCLWRACGQAGRQVSWMKWSWGQGWREAVQLERGKSSKGSVLRVTARCALLWFRPLFSTHYTTPYYVLGNNIYISWLISVKWIINWFEKDLKQGYRGSRLVGTHAYPLSHRGFLQSYFLEDSVVALMTLLNGKGQHMFCFFFCEMGVAHWTKWKVRLTLNSKGSQDSEHHL